MFKSSPYLAVLCLCAACGGTSFQASESGGAGGDAQAGGADTGGESSSAGSESGGAAGEPDGSAGAAVAGSAGDTVSAGGKNAAGAGGRSAAGGTSAGGASAAGAGGTSAGGASAAGAGGTMGSGGATCASIKAEFEGALQKARVCDKGSLDECSTQSTQQPWGCGCSVLVNAKSEYAAIAKKKYAELEDAKCTKSVNCPLVACGLWTSASCAQESMGTGTSFVCVGKSGPVAN